MTDKNSDTIVLYHSYLSETIDLESKDDDNIALFY